MYIQVQEKICHCYENAYTNYNTVDLNLRKPALFCSDKRAADLKLKLLSRKKKCEIIPDTTTNIFLRVK